MKKAQLNVILPIGGILILLIILVSVFAFGTRGGTSFTSPVAGCRPTQINYALNGILVIEDDSWAWGGEPAVKEIKGLGLRKLALFEQEFDYKIKLIDRTTGAELDTNKGSGTILSGESSVDKPFSLLFSLPDNDCNGVIDDTSLTIVAEAKETNDFFSNQHSDIERTVTIQNGRII